MKTVVILLIFIIFMGCSTIRYDDNLHRPYTQEEMEMGAFVSIGFGIAATFLGQFIYEEVR